MADSQASRCQVIVEKIDPVFEGKVVKRQNVSLWATTEFKQHTVPEAWPKGASLATGYCVGQLKIKCLSAPHHQRYSQEEPCHWHRKLAEDFLDRVGWIGDCKEFPKFWIIKGEYEKKKVPCLGGQSGINKAKRTICGVKKKNCKDQISFTNSQKYMAQEGTSGTNGSNFY
ncbi:hypothetical protein CROQUDRAFT_706161 [Cronartium quercuum f. sp. fusiforme G11]|uniref:Uncharacterized protein n=1 Tax=Cronartium quercuum f. sp. fusiforme G11 TaxID=708437 RepID=A0A9P6TGZ6_9BASI|nr:hypothetical protein CROQUDRAFT_706161 [Cronartium quercuum f. sp. fusiforme G11]